MKRLFFKLTLIGLLAFFGFAPLVFPCNNCSKRRPISRLGVNSDQKESSRNLNNIDLEAELEKRQQAAESLSRKSKEIQDSAKDSIINLRD